MKRIPWVLLGIYLSSLILLIWPHSRVMVLVLGSIGAILLLLFLWRVIRDDLLFYGYNLLALLTLPLAMQFYNPYSMLTIGLGYLLLTILLLHIYTVRFENKFKVIHRDTVIYVILAVLLGYLSVYLFMYYPIGYGLWGAVALMALILFMLYLILRPEPKKRRNAS